MSAPVSYTVQWQNQSTQVGRIFMFQQQPNIGVPNVTELAWFSKYVYPTTLGSFQWQVSYNFCWGETGVLAPGVLFTAAQMPPADLSLQNQITLTRQGAYNFINQGQGPTAGSLYINQDSTILPNAAAVGIGMSNAGTYVVPAQPNMQLVFTPTPTYWIAFGNYMQGQALDIESISNPMQITFPAGVLSMTTVFQRDNIWSTPVPTGSPTARQLFVEEEEPQLAGSRR